MEKAASLPSSWEEIPPDLLGLVLLRLPSLTDRVRLRATCRPWRAGAQPQLQPLLPPLLPWLALRDGSLVGLDGAPVRCAPILREGVFSYRAVDNLAFLVHDDGGCSLMNPLSGLTLPLPELAAAVRRALDESKFYDQSDIRNTYVKAELSSPLHSAPDPIVAFIIMEGSSVAISACKQHDAISISMRPKRTRGSPRIRPISAGMCPEPERAQGPRRIDDIAFLHGKLYALTCHEGLRVIALDASHLSKPSSDFHQCIANDPKQQEVYNYGNDPAYLVLRYLAESNGRLLMMRRWMSVPLNARLGDHDRTLRFEVFEADLATIPGRWTKVNSLAGHAIFLSTECSKSVLASQCAGGVQKDCIYFMHRVFDNPSKVFVGSCVDPLGDSGVYNMRSGEITPLLPEAVMAELRRKQRFLTWFFPADA